jgi:alanine-glyoxylate transaminase/(R)-3-amino-2-methylpropionate-pyruvate transaminase
MKKILKKLIKNNIKNSYSKEVKLPNFDYKPQAYKGRSKEEILELRNKHINPGIFKYYKKPLMIVEGKMQYMFDETGRRYLDFLGGIVTISVGHCHPRLVEVASKQFGKLVHSTTLYLTEELSEYAKDLTDKLPYFYF